MQIAFVFPAAEKGNALDFLGTTLDIKMTDVELSSSNDLSATLIGTSGITGVITFNSNPIIDKPYLRVSIDNYQTYEDSLDRVIGNGFELENFDGTGARSLIALVRHAPIPVAIVCDDPLLIENQNLNVLK